jgi:hypothetical protein
MKAVDNSAYSTYPSYPPSPTQQVIGITPPYPNKMQWETIMKALSLLCGALLVILGILSFVLLNVTDPINFILTIYYL